MKRISVIATIITVSALLGAGTMKVNAQSVNSRKDTVPGQVRRPMPGQVNPLPPQVTPNRVPNPNTIPTPGVTPTPMPGVTPNNVTPGVTPTPLPGANPNPVTPGVTPTPAPMPVTPNPVSPGATPGVTPRS